ncbi:MAG TPA: hypothetical protein VEI82_07585 [Myxococcota bacterium]|nr:hypothetical protein [Myxococcota bacterium]
MSEASHALTIDDLVRLRATTEKMAKVLGDRLALQLEALRPVLSPRRLLGRHVRGGARDELPGADRAFARLRERYAAACGRPFGLAKELEDEPLSLEPLLEVHPFAYAHTLEGDGRVVTITSPFRWVVGYRAPYTLAQLEIAVAQRATLRPGDARQFLLGALVLEDLLETFSELRELLRELRYEVAIEKRPSLGELPLVTLRSLLPSFRPPDALIAKAIQLSGVPAFIELADLDALPRLSDPLREALEAATRSTG